MKKSFYLILILITLLFSCSKKHGKIIVPSFGYDYAGLVVGKYVVYNVNSFYYDDFYNSIDSSFFQLKEVVDSKFIDLAGDEAFKIIRYRKESDTTDWVITDVWSSKLITTNFQKVEENVRFIKLIFPINVTDSWNGNALNNNEEIRYNYTAVNQSETIGGNALNEVLTVLQYKANNLVEEQFFQEKYAKGIGMVYKKTVDITKKRNSVTGLYERSLGYDITLKLDSFGG